MTVCFDLISDLHLESWPQEFDWTHQATSPWCIVAGDVCRDRDLLRNTLEHLGRCYQGVFYIDGNDEHYGRYNELSASYQELHTLIRPLNNVVYLQDNVVIMEETAIVGTNGWWTFDFDTSIDIGSVRDWWCQTYNFEADVFDALKNVSQRDCRYLQRSLLRLQSERIKHIVIVTHTVPYNQLIKHDIDLSDDVVFNVMGTDRLMLACQGDLLDKVHTWCFGHYHGSVDQAHSGIRFINNCRGRGNSPYRKSVFRPLRLEIRD